ncbi:MAG: C39 family peptidase [Firmicutes bacterium]|nr:C39 family peptidase [Bacillota bacterium]
MKAWLTHLLRTQVVVVGLSIAVIALTETPAFSDPPAAIRHVALWRSTEGRLTLLKGGQGVLIKAPVFNQFPQYHNGCEVTSLSMLLNYEQVHVDKLTLGAQVKRTTAPLVTNASGTIVSWGNPNVGFVGNMSGMKPGYGVYHAPIAALMRKYLPHDTLDLTGAPFASVLAVLRTGRPVIVWTTVTFSPDVPWVVWQSPQGPVRATMYEHAVLLVGYDATDVYVNNPLGGIAQEPVPITAFRASWDAMGRQAITVIYNR